MNHAELSRERLSIVPVTLASANDFVRRLHRHNKPVAGHRFSVGVADQAGTLRGVAIVGRPVAPKLDDGRAAEITRLCTDGTRNACSMLYGAARRAAKALEYSPIYTYTLPDEGGASLRAAGWICEGNAGGGQWKHTDGKPRRTDQPTDVKSRWSRALVDRETWSFNLSDIENDAPSADEIFLWDGEQG